MQDVSLPVNLTLPENLLRYSSDAEYHEVFNLFFWSTPIELEEDHYEEAKVKAGRAWIYRQTCADPFWLRVYSLAAGKFFSIDVEIGICVLLNYDYFPDFYRAFRKYIKLGYPATAAGVEPDPEYDRLCTALLTALEEPSS